ncbi:F-box only protein 40 [Mastacembelus armatus]|uniref:F-box protein 40 n=1 Tax=Mastacembelus armatus TaxID=205130 RepID=A0A3Q3M4N9_9TELE|nr:F-box only protein 40 [Mastacembelus armatus]
MSVGHHKHCEKCYNVHCQVPVQISISCMVIKCPKTCGAILHMCKQEEHQRLCPNETVPCLNASYGCPLTMLRHRLARHLEVCPASVVCCSQEWNRWPILETDQTFYRNVSEKPQTELHLDVAMALRDQDLLFQSIKMKNIFPELMKEDPVLQDIAVGVNCPAEEAACSLDCSEFAKNGFAMVEEKQPCQGERDDLAQSIDVESIQNYSSWEKIFTKEMDGCKQTVKNLNRREKKGKEEAQEPSNCQGEIRDSHLNQESSSAAQRVDGATGLAPWQDGVLERLGKEVNIAEYNMYLVHNGTMLINFGQLAACTPREKDFVYGNLEPIEVKTVRSFNVPTSYRAKRSHLKDPTHKAKTTHQSTDTADLGVSVEDLPNCDVVSATLLCSLEKELKGHLISESVGIDGIYVDIGTQTYSFSSAPFKIDASLADVIADKPWGLYVDIETEPVTRRHNKTSSAFSYMCGHFFRRDEYRSHFRNVHSDIQASLSGWLQQRCPLAYLGCTFAQTRLQPAGQQATIKFCQDVSTFVLQPQVLSSLFEGGKKIPQRNGSHNLDLLSRLPLEILQHIAGYLDSFTLSQLSQVSHLMRQVCATLLQERGMVSLKWEKKTYSHGGTSWRCRKKVWEFSSLFSYVDRWSFSNAPSMSAHLKTCSFYQREERTEPVALACLGEVRDKLGEVKHKR